MKNLTQFKTLNTKFIKGGLVMAFEEEFGSEISDSEAEKILTVGDAIRFIENNPAK